MLLMENERERDRENKYYNKCEGQFETKKNLNGCRYSQTETTHL